MARKPKSPLAQLGLLFDVTPKAAPKARKAPTRKASKPKAAPKARKAKAPKVAKPRKVKAPKAPRKVKSRARTTADSEIHVTEYDRRRGRLPRRHPAGDPYLRGGRWKPDNT